MDDWLFPTDSVCPPLGDEDELSPFEHFNLPKNVALAKSRDLGTL